MNTVGTARISDCGKYRYQLRRVWADALPWCTFVMVNPSTADAENDDPTISKCIRFARSLGYGGLIVVNLFALRATDPRELYSAADPIGPENDLAIYHASNLTSVVIAAWGNHGTLRDRDIHVMRNSLASREVRCLGINKNGTPKHPLYIRGDTVPSTYYGRPVPA